MQWGKAVINKEIVDGKTKCKWKCQPAATKEFKETANR